jgi:hypothetical protein
MMRERNLLKQEEPLFLDEPPDAPRHAKSSSASIDDLFADEDAPNPWTTIPAPPDHREAPQSAGSELASPATQAPERKQADQRFGAATVLLLIMLAAVLGFSAASALLR